MTPERLKTTAVDDKQPVDPPGDEDRETVGGSAMRGAISTEKVTENDSDLSAAQSSHTVNDQYSDDICTASLEAAPPIGNNRSRDYHPCSDAGKSQVESEAQSIRDDILEQKDTRATTVKHAKQNIEGADKTTPKQHQKADDIDALTFIKDKKGRYRPLPEQRLRNNLLASVGFLEFANATDFAANVWNTIPVPKFATALMGLGGAVALSLVPFAVWDARLCWENSKMLIEERILLFREAGVTVDEEKGKLLIARHKGLDTRLEVNRKELGSELFDRGSMDLLMGISAFLVGIGTIMAIGGANPRVYRASNLLSGYIGNSPSSFWGVCNTAWSIYVFRRAQHHITSGEKQVLPQEIRDLLRKRVRAVQLHSVLMGTSTMVSAAAGMVTATHWYGYPFLVVCIIIAIFGNWYSRKRLNYDRPLVVHAGHVKMNKELLVQEIEWVASMQASLGTRHTPTIFNKTITKPTNTKAVIDLTSRCDLFEELCERLLMDASFRSLMGITSEASIEISPADVAAIGEEYEPTVIAKAKAVLQEKGRRQLRQKQRYLLEMLGASLVEHQAELPAEMTETRGMNNG